MNIRPEHLVFVREAEEFFEENKTKESYRCNNRELLALRRGIDRNCIEVIEINPSTLFFENMLEKCPIEDAISKKPPGHKAPSGHAKITKVLTVDGVRIHWVPHEWNGFEYVITPEDNRKFEDIYLHCVENDLKDYNFNLWNDEPKIINPPVPLPWKFSHNGEDEDTYNIYGNDGTIVADDLGEEIASFIVNTINSEYAPKK